MGSIRSPYPYDAAAQTNATVQKHVTTCDLQLRNFLCRNYPSLSAFALGIAPCGELAMPR
jgi:hypothetical protein